MLNRIHWIRKCIIISCLSCSQLLAQTVAIEKEAQVYICPPCGGECDKLVFDKPGKCPGCGMTLALKTAIRNVAILIFDGVEILDFAGPYEVFAADGVHFHAFTVAKSREPITTGIGEMVVTPTHSFADCPKTDILIIPGGGTGEISRNKEVLEFIRTRAASADVVLSVCTGAFVLGAAGLLDGLSATTHHADVEELRRAFPKVDVQSGKRFIDNGKFVTAAGVSAGIDASLHLVERLVGKEAVESILSRMQYTRQD
jgi:transcriptional regulator GlxA family with amidase domain